jgi:hypothetical protein
MTHELQFKSTGENRLQYVAGLYYLHENKSIRYDMEMLNNKSVFEDPDLPLGFNPDGLPDSWVFDQAKRTTTSKAAFAQLDFRVVDKVNLTLGYRYSDDEKTDENGMIQGELSHWIPEIRDFEIGGFRIDSVDGMVTWKRFLQQGDRKIPPGAQHALPQLSTMLAFDYLINNSDRWSGSNAKGSPDGKVFYLMDNTLSFGPEREGHTRVRIYLERSKKFSRRLIAALRSLDDEVVRRPDQPARLVGGEPDGRIVLELADRRLRLPAVARPAVEAILASERLAIRSLPGIDDESKLVLARRLIREELLRPAEPG